MPIYQPEYWMEITCRKCGYQRRLKCGGYGDVIGRKPVETARALRDLDNPVDKCPRCGSEDIEVRYYKK